MLSAFVSEFDGAYITGEFLSIAADYINKHSQ